MRWVGLSSPCVRCNVRRFHLLPTTPATLQQPHGAAPKLQKLGRRYVATKEPPQTKSLQLGAVSPPPRQHPLEDQAVIQRGKPPPNAPNYGVSNEHANSSKAVEQEDISEVPAIDRPANTALHGDTAELMGKAKPVMSAADFFKVAAVPGHQKINRYANKPHRANKAGDPDAQGGGHTLAFDLSNQLPEPVALSSSDHSGYSIDAHGWLQIKSTEKALQEHHTALVFTSVSRNMVEVDFTRLLAYTHDWGTGQSGLLQVIPGRDVDFDRLSYWILLFNCPYNAASLQHRLRWYHANAMLNLPVNPYTAATIKKRELTPPEGYVDPLTGEDIWKRLHEFALFLPTQSFTATAVLAPFPDTVLTELRNHRLWKSPTPPNQSWPLRIWVDECDLQADQVERFLITDGKERGSRWELLHGAERIEPMVYTRINGRGERLSRENLPLSKKNLALLHASSQKNMVVRFRTQKGALLFWRTWHRRPVPQSLSNSPVEERLLHVDPLW